ncbi:hypothetical protein [Ramlibacter sp.]|uniref:hypothetical protein n=1 Tax=Ramlibacter sp. TaxID=1917967 RepID=UPI0018091264|nr:hypothetical protein [Ramlibacter sp.]MBA2672563.1 hypothetical protein [Ramlibacter sp.]
MKKPSSTTTGSSPRFLLVGDSHAGAIGKAARADALPFCGGPMGSGRDFTVDFFDRCEGDLRFRKAPIERYYRGFLAELGAARLAELKIPVVSTIGFSIHFYASNENWDIYRARGAGFDPAFLSGRLFAAIVLAMARDAFAFYREVRAMALRVVAVLPPQRVPQLSDAAVFFAAQEVVLRAVAATGAEIVDLRAATTGAGGLQRADLCEANDPLHGNVAFGRLVLAALAERGI